VATVDYFPKNKLTKLANSVQFKRMRTFCLEDSEAWAPCLPPPWLRHWLWRRFKPTLVFLCLFWLWVFTLQAWIRRTCKTCNAAY